MAMIPICVKAIFSEIKTPVAYCGVV